MELRHCGNVLTPYEVIVFSPADTLLLDMKVKYRKAPVSLLDFKSISFGAMRCPGTCTGLVYAWQGVNHEGETCDTEKIPPKEVDTWLSITKNVNNTRAKGASAVTGSLAYWPYSYREMIPIG